MTRIQCALLLLLLGLLGPIVLVLATGGIVFVAACLFPQLAFAAYPFFNYSRGIGTSRLLPDSVALVLSVALWGFLAYWFAQFNGGRRFPEVASAAAIWVAAVWVVTWAGAALFDLHPAGLSCRT